MSLEEWRAGARAIADLSTYAGRPVWLRAEKTKGWRSTSIPCEVRGVRALLIVVAADDIDWWVDYLDGLYPGRLRGIVGGN